MTKKRVWCLYRVSTNSQVYNGEDIPLQENACRKFVRANKEWELTNELYERGVSGWKKSTDDRDELVRIKKAATNNEFDVLVVFMFDRLGRNLQESPLVVQFLVEEGVEVWSAKEGQAKLEEHSDLLINYIRFWQSSGESKKTSIRVKEIMSQMNEEGKFTGGKANFGYEVYETDMPHPKKKDRNIKDIRINKEEAQVVKLIFELSLLKGYGASRIAKYLNDDAHDNRGKIWRHNTISRMLRNPIYMGRPRYNFTNDNGKINPIDEWKLQPLHEDLIIISEDEFLKTQELIEKRKTIKGSEIEAPTSSELLLSGIAICGYCNHRLKADYSIKKYKRKTDGIITKTIQPRYRCHYAHNTNKHPKYNFGAKMYEEQVENIVIEVLSKLNLDSFAEEANKYKHEHVNQKIVQLNKLNDQMQTKYRALDKLNDEIVKVIMGESKWTEDRLNIAITKTEEDIKTLQKQISSIEKEIEQAKVEMSNIEYLKTEFNDWIPKYKNADLQSKKMMLSRIIKEVTFKEKEINVSFKLTIENAIGKTDENVVYNHSNSEPVRGTFTLQDMLNKHLEQQGLRNIEFVIERKVA